MEKEEFCPTCGHMIRTLRKIQKKFTDKEFLKYYNDKNYTSDMQIAKALNVVNTAVWARRVYLNLKPKYNRSNTNYKKSIERIRKFARNRRRKLTTGLA